MASIVDDPNGRKRIQFVAADGRRRQARLGKMTMKQAEAVKLHVERLIVAPFSELPLDTAQWLAGLEDTLHGRLAAVGLVKPRKAKRGGGLKKFIDDYLAQRPDVKPGTMIVMRQAERHLVRFLGEDTDPAEVTPADADAYRAHLLGESRSRATVAKWCYYARHYFEVARRRKLLTENPFAHIKGQVHGNPARRVFVPAEHARRVIAAAPDPQWKLLIAMARWQGVRVPSEVVDLRWTDVNFELSRLTIRASKTAHHADGGIRVVPIFPEVRPYLLDVFEHAPEGEAHVLPRFRDGGMNLRTQFNRYVAAAGLAPWPKPWQNMRSTRATELADKFPSHVCTAWLGHNEAVANEFYRQVTDEHFTRAVADATPTTVAHDAEAARNRAQNASELVGTAENVERTGEENQADLPTHSHKYRSVHDLEVGAAGFEPATKRL
ncbi:MAG: site-specific integrase [Phycisphaeraceae bacterium]|nr:site-specific integrase [Phycisphaeraceae bacterium]